jgi:hypothetical protein
MDKKRDKKRDDKMIMRMLPGINAVISEYSDHISDVAKEKPEDSHDYFEIMHQYGKFDDDDLLDMYVTQKIRMEDAYDCIGILLLLREGNIDMVKKKLKNMDSSPRSNLIEDLETLDEEFNDVHLNEIYR